LHRKSVAKTAVNKNLLAIKSFLKIM
jgi:hypothetical protein